MNRTHFIVEDENAKPVSSAPWKGHGKGKGTMKRIGLIAAVGVLSALSAYSAADGTAQPPPQDSKAETFLLVEVKGTIGKNFSAAKMKAAISEARTAKAAAVVLSMDTPGGSVAEAEAIVDLIIENKDLRFIALVNKALSAGAAITLACKEIYVMETATIGAAVSYVPGRHGVPMVLPADVAEKYQSAWRAVCRKAADCGGHSSLLAEGMADPGFAITKRTENGKVILERDGKGKLVKASGRILTLTAKEAVACGLAKAVVPDVADLGAKLGTPNWKRLDRPTLNLHDLNVLLYKEVNLPARTTAAARRVSYEEMKKEIIGRNAQLSGMLVNVVESKKGLVVYVNYTLKKTVYRRYSGDRVREDFVNTINIEMISEDNRWISAKTGSRVMVDGRILDIDMSVSTSRGAKEHHISVSTDIAMVEEEPKKVVRRPPPAPGPMDPEAEARKRLSLADTYERNGMTNQALKILRSVIKDFPDTAAAKHAAEQVKQLLEDEAKKVGNGS